MRTIFHIYPHESLFFVPQFISNYYVQFQTEQFDVSHFASKFWTGATTSYANQ